MKEKIKVTLPFTMTFNEALKYKNVKFSTAKEDINYTGKSLRKESKVVQTKKQYGDFSLTALSFASISIFSG